MFQTSSVLINTLRLRSTAAYLASPDQQYGIPGGGCSPPGRAIEPELRLKRGLLAAPRPFRPSWPPAVFEVPPGVELRHAPGICRETSASDLRPASAAVAAGSGGASGTGPANRRSNMVTRRGSRRNAVGRARIAPSAGDGSAAAVREGKVAALLRFRPTRRVRRDRRGFQHQGHGRTRFQSGVFPAKVKVTMFGPPSSSGGRSVRPYWWA
jgi:hypothetical protein